ncbi:hypothetical protein LF844_16885 [Metapseudomonas lalkuanensis]|uniref:hypothetical protein n=1 Tax=Metapseudomonas lalkuanensis TaxID=2604832 RepID=UPI001CF5F31E|nr:hypothetical protein [Pseudomonas lalkuanensis]UCO96350.1 hypothetical protein LF844_16885 [Pseudomonas lalkuanensis]
MNACDLIPPSLCRSCWASRTGTGFDAGWLKVKAGLATVLASRRDDRLSPDLIHRRAEHKKKSDGKIHRPQADERILTGAFKECQGRSRVLQKLEGRGDAGFPRSAPSPYPS